MKIKGQPDAAGCVEIGYGIDDAFQKNGYATEAVSTLVQMACTSEGAKSKEDVYKKFVRKRESV